MIFYLKVALLMCVILCYLQGISPTTLSPDSSAAGDPPVTPCMQF